MKLFKYTCGIDEKIGVFADSQEAYDRRDEVDATFHFLPVTIEEITVPGYVIVISGAGDKSALQTMREMLEVQGQDGNWNVDPYMHGMYNGMEFMLSVVENREPVYRDAPETWLGDKDPDQGTPNDQATVDEIQPKPPDFDAMDANQLRAWLDEREIKYHVQLGEKKLRELCVTKYGESAGNE